MRSGRFGKERDGDYAGYIRGGPVVARGRFELPSTGPKPVIDRACWSLASPLHHRAMRGRVAITSHKPSSSKAKYRVFGSLQGSRSDRHSHILISSVSPK